MGFGIQAFYPAPEFPEEQPVEPEAKEELMKEEKEDFAAFRAYEEEISSASGPPSSVLGWATSVLPGGTSPGPGGALIGSVRGGCTAFAPDGAPGGSGASPGLRRSD